MNKIVVIIVAIIIVGGGAYYYFTKTTTAPAENAQEQTLTPQAPQVAGQDAVVGTGALAEPGSSVEVLYVGMLQDGTVFDSSANNNNQPLVFTLGAPGIIPGFQIGINGMREGGERRIQIPPELGYGAQEIKDANGKVIVPANATLIFDVKLDKVAAASTTPATE